MSTMDIYAQSEIKEENICVCERMECEDQKTRKITGSIFPLALEIHIYMYVYIGHA